ncbi:MAG: hypothetical protein K2Z81_02325 [Cyanobacteria bacterium]|nr:hypothetical protein [Cyanobacteriota bacterium]
MRLKIFDQRLKSVFDRVVHFGKEIDLETNSSEFLAPPGNYLVQIDLPSGDTLSESCTVEDQEVSTVTFLPTRSAHEWLGTETLFDDVFSESAQRSSTGKTSDNCSTGLSIKKLLLWQDGKYETSDHDLQFHRISSFEQDPYVKFFIAPHISDLCNAVIEVAWGKDTFGMCVPFDHQFDIAFNCDTQRSFPDYTISLKNPIAASLLSYWISGDLVATKKVGTILLDQARNLLDAKFDDFTSACIAGYFLVWTRQTDKVPEDWFDNLSTYFKQSSDSAVINAWRLLSAQRNEEAFSAFIESAHRGLPLFTHGVRFLLDGLQMFANDDHWRSRKSEAVTAMNKLKRYANTIHWSRPYTLFSLSTQKTTDANYDTLIKF